MFAKLTFSFAIGIVTTITLGCDEKSSNNSATSSQLVQQQSYDPPKKANTDLERENAELKKIIALKEENEKLRKELQKKNDAVGLAAAAVQPVKEKAVTAKDPVEELEKLLNTKAGRKRTLIIKGPLNSWYKYDETVVDISFDVTSTTSLVSPYQAVVSLTTAKTPYVGLDRPDTEAAERALTILSKEEIEFAEFVVHFAWQNNTWVVKHFVEKNVHYINPAQEIENLEAMVETRVARFLSNAKDFTYDHPRWPFIPLVKNEKRVNNQQGGYSIIIRDTLAQ